MAPSSLHEGVAEELREWWEDLVAGTIESRLLVIGLPPGAGRSTLLDRFADQVGRDAEHPSIVVRVDGTELAAGLAEQLLVVREAFGRAELDAGTEPQYVSALGRQLALLLASLGVGPRTHIRDDSPAGENGAAARLGEAVARASTRAPVVVVIDAAELLEVSLAVRLLDTLVERPDGRVLIVVGAGPSSELVRAMTRRQRYGAATQRTFVIDTGSDTDAGSDDDGPTTRDGVTHETADHAIETALRIIRDPGSTALERLVAGRAAHRARDDAQDRGRLLEVQRALVAELEAMHDADALTVAREALAGRELQPEADDLRAAVVRLGIELGDEWRDDPAVIELTDRALETGETMRLDAAIWAAVALLDTAARRPGGFDLARQIDDRLAGVDATIEVVDACRLLLGFHAGRAGNLELCRQLLSLLVHDREPLAVRQIAASRVLNALQGPLSDLHIIAIAYEAELADATNDDERLRLHEALASAYVTGGDYRRGLSHSTSDLELRNLRLGPDHHGTLRTRANIAELVGNAGYPGDAVQLYQVLLPDLVRVLGPDHPHTFISRGNLAQWTGATGQTAEALRLYEELLPDQLRILGPDHPNVVTTRANVAQFTGNAGDTDVALQLYEALLPDQIRVLGPDHPNTLTTRANLAQLTGHAGHGAEALRSYQELLPDLDRVLGSDHPYTLTTRINIAQLTGETGQPDVAVRLYEALLPDLDRVFGPRQPHTLTARANIAQWTASAGQPAEALVLYEALLRDQIRVLGGDHPNTLITRASIAQLAGDTGHTAEALHRSQALLPDLVRVLGQSHPSTAHVQAEITRLEHELR